MNAPGSPSSPLQMMYFVSPGEAAANFRREPGATTTAQTRSEDLLDDRRGSHGGEGRARGRVAAPGEVLVEALRIDDAHVAQSDARLLLVEGDIVGAGDAFAGGGIDVQQLLDDLPTGEVLLDHALHVLDLEPGVVRVTI